MVGMDKCSNSSEILCLILISQISWHSDEKIDHCKIMHYNRYLSTGHVYHTQLAFFINLQRAVIGPSATWQADNGPL